MANETFISLHQARKALEENQRLLSPEKYRIARNTNEALLHLLQGLERISEDVERLHNRLDPILRAISEDYQVADDILRKGR